MKNLILILFFSLLVINQGQAQVNDSLDTYLSIVIPQRSGLISADFKHYRVKNDSLYVFYQPMLDTNRNYKLLETYPIDQNNLNQLDSLLAQTDSLGHHTAGIFIMGLPRFLIYAKYKGEQFDGYIANCYRAHIFVFVDWLNRVYPNQDVIDYNKTELIKQENKENFESLVGFEMTFTGKPINAKLGALLITNDNLDLWINDMDSWPDGFYNGLDSSKALKVTGELIEKYDLPVYIHKDGEPMKSGIPVPEGTNLKLASHRFLLKNITWEFLEVE